MVNGRNFTNPFLIHKNLDFNVILSGVSPLIEFKQFNDWKFMLKINNLIIDCVNVLQDCTDINVFCTCTGDNKFGMNESDLVLQLG